MRFLVLFLFVFAFSVHGQILEPVKWSKTMTDKETVKVGDELVISFKAVIDEKWYLYSSDFDPELGPMVTTFSFVSSSSYELVGEIVPVDRLAGYDSLFEGEYTYFKKQGLFQQTVKVLQPDVRIEGVFDYQVCSDLTGQCIPFEESFLFTVSSRGTSEGEEISKNMFAQRESNDPYSLLSFMLVAFLAGLAALLTPCVFPMIPMTVTYFAGKDQKKKGRVKNSLIYGFSIILIYAMVGAVLAPFMGPETANDLATGWLPNVIFFLVFFLFALSFFGLFEITIPHRWVNSVDRLGDKGGLLGVFFMALTLVLVSFSCTGPIVGSILVESAGGLALKPVLGMLAFSSAFAIPFTLFALFPGWLSSLPKSGGWLNRVKVILGFLELALAFKFLSIADQAYHWGLLDREIYLAIWIVIFTLLGCYLLGKLRFAADGPSSPTTVGGLLSAVITFSFVVYLVPGMFGAPLKAMAGYLPPMSTHDFDISQIVRQSSSNQATQLKTCSAPMYSDFLALPHGLEGYFNYDQALACAKETGKPVFVDFTGHGCVNCREMEARVWSDPRVLNKLREEFVVVALYVDDKTELPSSQWFTSKYDQKVKKTIGKQNADFQITKFENNAQPFYVLLSSEGELLVPPKAYDLDINNFVNFLDSGLTENAK
ncbi:MAG: thiol:disulfide interchange protein [Cyclobacteriaceae bacterium]|jgi:thiol:disulfide interchange protein